MPEFEMKDSTSPDSDKTPKIPSGPTISAVEAINWIARRTVTDAPPPQDNGGSLDITEFLKAERKLVGVLARGDFTARARRADPAYSAGPLQIGQGALELVPTIVFENPDVGISHFGTICGHYTVGGAPSRYAGPFYANVQFRTDDILKHWPEPETPLKPAVSAATLNVWLKKYVAAHQAKNTRPTRADMWRDLGEEFPNHHITNQVFKDVRKKCPKEWQNQGNFSR